ncbi:MAG: glycosyltransferase [Anaerolineae bacterium]
MEGRSSADAYDAFYYAHGCGTPYRRDDEWLRYFDSVAERVVSDIAPESVLDVGCAMGFLVEALHKRGVESYGVDISPYAIGNVDPSISGSCWVGRATEELPRDYDLVVCIEVLEHLSPQEADEAVANMCAHTDDVVFSSTPFDYAELTHLNVQPPEYWASLFARHGFVRDVGFDASFIAPWTVRFRRSKAPLPRVVEAYERRLWQLEQERLARRDVAIELRNELSGKGAVEHQLRLQVEGTEAERDDLAERLQSRAQEVHVLASQVRAWENRWHALETSMAWAMIQRLQSLRAAAAPEGSRRTHALDTAFWWYQFWQARGTGGLARRLRTAAARRARFAAHNARLRSPLPVSRRLLVLPVEEREPVRPHAATVDVVVCVHNALDDVRECLASVVRHSREPYGLVVVDDGSDAETAELLARFCRGNGATLVRNVEARGYTRAANQGMAESSADYVLLLNSDTVVGAGWLDRLVACAESDPAIGVVGPLSNTASWQSVPEVLEDGDWARNELPEGMSVDDMASTVAVSSARLFPEVAFLNGFCLLIKRGLIDQIGTFDEERFGAGYGEENDYCLRARAAGWRLAVADDTYVYHAQSKSYSDERRLQLYDRADAALVDKHGRAIVEAGVAEVRDSRVLGGIRASTRAAIERRAALAAGRDRFAGRSVLFVLPVMSPGGGANIVISEATAMVKMGVDAVVFNLDRFKGPFEDAYPDLELPVVYGRYDEVPESLSEIAGQYDAVVATVYATVDALREVSRTPGCEDVVMGYYIQDFEPYFFDPGSGDFHRAWQSYKLVPDLVRFTKTEWNRRELETLVGVDSVVVGPSYDVDLFRPRPRPGPEPPDRPVRVSAMIRPETPYRSPELTMEILRDAARKHGSSIEVVLFGVEPDDPALRELPLDFPWRSAGVLGPHRVARLMSDIDVFVDFSSHQAMGLTALEAMACGTAVVVSGHGGAATYARDQQNCLVVDVSSPDVCRAALDRVIEDHALRRKMGRNAIDDVSAYYPEGPALRILEALFRSGAGPS